MSRPRKLTATEVREVRDWYAARKALTPTKVMVSRYNISRSNLYKIGRGLAYKVMR